MLVTAGAVSPLMAGPIDPRLHFSRLDTPHFTIYFHQDEEPLARHLLAIVEDIRTSIGANLQISLPAHTHVVLADQAEFANGFATPLPRDLVFLNATAPSGAEFIGNAEDWLRVLFTHEYTHIVHMDRSRGWSAIARGLFGRAPLAFPNLTLPQWQLEGLATWQESVLTGFGRKTAGDFRAIETTAARRGRPMTLDRASGGLVTWPDGHAQYAAGLGFHEYLADTFGAASLGRLADATARRLPYLGTRAYRRIYGESLGVLWGRYSDDVRRRASAARMTANAARLTHAASAVVTGPRFAPAACSGCPQDIIYSVESADAFPELRQIQQDGTRDRALATRYLGSTVGLSDARVVFDQVDVHRAVGMYADLYELDRRTGDVRRLTHEARLQDPDLSPDGRRIVATRQHGDRRDLVVLDVPAGQLAMNDELGDGIVVVASDEMTSYSAPRWSPGGTLIAVERRRQGALPEVSVIEAATGHVVTTLSSADARIVTPTWHPDEQAVVAAADFNGQPFDLYEFQLDGDRRVRRLTTSAGALWPDVSRDGRRLTYAGYTAEGYALFVDDYATRSDDTVTLRPRAAAVSPDALSGSAGAALNARGYSPLATLPPTSWTPVLYDDSDGTRVGGATYGADILGRHAYGLEATWLVDAPAVERASSRRVADWSASYAYTRWQPTFFASASRSTSSAVFANADSHTTSTIQMVEHQAQAGVSLPVPHVLHRTQWLASLLRTDRRLLFASADRNIRLTSARVAVAYSTARRYGYSISAEHGVAVGSTLEMATRALGSQANATTATLDARLYVPGIARHHAVALRTAAGVSNGAVLARQSFRLGTTSASTSVLDFGSDALGLFRGTSGLTVAGRQIVVANAEYRLPLVRVERGVGTWPVFLRVVHAAVFADAGRVRGIGSISTRWRHAEGAELSVDGVAGYALPFTMSVGAAWTHDDIDSHGPAAYVRLGHSF